MHLQEKHNIFSCYSQLNRVVYKAKPIVTSVIYWRTCRTGGFYNMTSGELLDLLKTIQESKQNTQTHEVVSARYHIPTSLYESLSSFSNQDEGGIIVFGVDKEQKFMETGVYDPQYVIKEVIDLCLQMNPIPFPIFTIAQKNNMYFVSAEISGLEPINRPCFYKVQNKFSGSYMRIKGKNLLMNRQKLSAYISENKSVPSDTRSIERAAYAYFNQDLITEYISSFKIKNPYLTMLNEKQIYELMSIKREGIPTVNSLLLFSPYPQSFFPQFCIIASAIASKEADANNHFDTRLLDQQRIEGNIPDMINKAMKFVRKNIGTKTIFNPTTTIQEQIPILPLNAIKESIINAIVHRDYSSDMEDIPINLIIYEDCVIIQSPGELYGDQQNVPAKQMQIPKRNAALAKNMEILGIIKNTGPGISEIESAMEEYSLCSPKLIQENGFFIVKLYNTQKTDSSYSVNDIHNLVAFCQTPKTRAEICQYLGLASQSYAIQTYVNPLVNSGRIRLSLPEKPSSHKQLYYSNF